MYEAGDNYRDKMYSPGTIIRRRGYGKMQQLKTKMEKEVKTIAFWRAVVCECLGTFLYVFGGCLPYAVRPVSPTQDPVRAALTFGFLAATLTQCFGHISGGHMNPAITLGMLLTNKMTPLRALLYFVAQCGGSIAGAALIIPFSQTVCCDTLGRTSLSPGLSANHGLGLELTWTFVLVFTVMATVDPCRRMLGSQPLAIGLTVFTAHLIIVDSTGCSINPARSFGPAFIANKWENHWIYWAGPLAGGAVAAMLYEHIFQPIKPPKTRRRSYSSVYGSAADVEKDELGFKGDNYRPVSTISVPPEFQAYSNGFSRSEAVPLSEQPTLPSRPRRENGGQTESQDGSLRAQPRNSSAVWTVNTQPNVVTS